MRGGYPKNTVIIDMTVMQGVRVTVAAVGRGYPKTAVTTVTAVTPKDGHPPKERRNPPMPYASCVSRNEKRAALRLVNATTSGRKKPTKATQI